MEPLTYNTSKNEQQAQNTPSIVDETSVDFDVNIKSKVVGVKGLKNTNWGVDNGRYVMLRLETDNKVNFNVVDDIYENYRVITHFSLW